jgi:hypothetical protein
METTNERPTYMATETHCLDSAIEKGFTCRFKVFGSYLFALDERQQFTPSQVSIINFYRFEGISDPDDMSIIYLIATDDGHLGTLVDAYGIYADPDVAAFILAVQNISKKTVRGWS